MKYVGTQRQLEIAQGERGYVGRNTKSPIDIQQARNSLVQAQANRYADTAALFQALGGGWWHRNELMQADSIPSKDEK